MPKISQFFLANMPKISQFFKKQNCKQQTYRGLGFILYFCHQKTN